MAGPEDLARGGQYSRPTGLVYIFNLIVGTGALTLPAAFHDAGYVSSGSSGARRADMIGSICSTGALHHHTHPAGLHVLSNW